MCRASRWCSELPTDPAAWSRDCPLSPPQWFSLAAFAFRRALVAAVENDRDTVREELALCRSNELQRWFIDHAQNVGRFRAQGLEAHRLSNRGLVNHDVGPAAPHSTANAASAVRAQRYPRELERSLFARDGWHCRYCGVPIVTPEAQRLLHRLVGPELYPLGRTNLGRHGVRLTLSANLDHVNPWSTGGASNDHNLVTACWCCNFGKSHHSLSDLGLDDPRLRNPIHTDWDGGSQLTPAPPRRVDTSR